MDMSFEQALGVDDGQGGLESAVHGVTKSHTWLSNWTEMNMKKFGIRVMELFYISILVMVIQLYKLIKITKICGIYYSFVNYTLHRKKEIKLLVDFMH